MLDWGDLRFFLAVAERGSASAAARGLQVDKGTISRRVSALERSVGVRLFDRKASGWALTQAGRTALASVRRVDAVISVMQTEIGGASPEARVPVRLTAPQWFCSEVLLPGIALLQNAERWISLGKSDVHNAKHLVVECFERV